MKGLWTNKETGHLKPSSSIEDIDYSQGQMDYRKSTDESIRNELPFIM